MSFTDRLIHGWNAFMNKDPTPLDRGSSHSYRPDRVRLTKGSDRSITTSVYNRIAMDCSAIDIKHIRLDDDERYKEVIKSNLNYCLTAEANIDQTGRALLQDIVMSMFNEGVVAIVPVETDISPIHNGGYDITSLRTAKIMEWYPKHVKIRLYNDNTGKREEIILPKKTVAIVENPMFAVMNEPNSTAQRLIRKLALLDVIDEQNGSGKLDLIIQLPYVIKTEARRQQAETRRKDIEKQLSSSNLGIAYTDGTERVTQLNRPIENQLLSQIESLTRMLYSQLGLTEEIMNGTADEKVMNNYYNRTIEPIMSAIVLEMRRKFLTKTARSQKQTIMYFRDPFKLVPTSELAELADKFTRNEIMSSNEIRQIIGMKPSEDPRADELVNSNISQSNEDPRLHGNNQEDQEVYDDAELQSFDDIESQLSELESMMQSDNSAFLKHYASKYYDPVKAHEYYMEYTKNHRLKGREEGKTYTTSRLNDKGKMAYRQVSEKIAAEKQEKLDALKKRSGGGGSSSSNEAERKAMRAEIKKYDTEMKRQLIDLKEQIRTLKSKKKNPNSFTNQAAIQDKIKKLREDNNKKKQELTKQYQLKLSSSSGGSNTASNSSEESSRIREEYKNILFNELKNMIDSGEFKKISKKQ